ENLVNQIERITTSGVVTEFTIPTTPTGAAGIVAAPDGSLWFAEHLGNKIGHLLADCSVYAVLGSHQSTEQSLDLSVWPGGRNVIALLDGGPYFSVLGAPTSQDEPTLDALSCSDVGTPAAQAVLTGHLSVVSGDLFQVGDAFSITLTSGAGNVTAHVVVTRGA